MSKAVFVKTRIILLLLILLGYFWFYYCLKNYNMYINKSATLNSPRVRPKLKFSYLLNALISFGSIALQVTQVIRFIRVTLFLKIE